MSNTTYYTRELDRIDTVDLSDLPTMIITDSTGNKTRVLTLNQDCIDATQAFLEDMWQRLERKRVYEHIKAKRNG